MQNPVLVIIAILAVAVFYVLLPIVKHTVRRYRGLKALRCPETGESVGVIIDAEHAALSAALRAPGEPELLVKHCSHWPERALCNQECLRDPANQAELYASPRPYATYYG
jgi:hypothetical protein